MGGTGRILGRGAVLLAFVVATWPAAPATACGNYTHVWAATDAVRFVPPGPLKDFLAREGLLNIVRNGAMYPDGGYAVDDGYGEISHWEPFHKAYLQWIRTTYSPPWSDEAARHIAFLMGMTAHGLSDQFYDGMYLTRHEFFDPYVGDAPYGLDGATDSCFAATQGEMELPDPWVPADELAPLYDPLGHHVEADVIAQGSGLVPFAIAHANAEASNPSTIAELTAFYPWACQHQADPAAPGSPVTHGPAIAAYWQVLWNRLAGQDGFADPLLGTFFTNASPWDYPADATRPDSWVSFAVPRGLDMATVTPQTIRITRDNGNVHPASINVTYGEDSHLVNLKPTVDWAANATYTVTIAPPLASWDGVTLEGTRSFTFATLPAPPELPPETVEASEPVPDLAEESGDQGGTRAEEAPADDTAATDLGEDTPATDVLDAENEAGSPPDAAGDVTGPADPTGGGGTSGGCSAGAPGTTHPAAWLPALLIGMAAASRRRHRRNRVIDPAA